MFSPIPQLPGGLNLQTPGIIWVLQPRQKPHCCLWIRDSMININLLPAMLRSVWLYLELPLQLPFPSYLLVQRNSLQHPCSVAWACWAIPSINIQSLENLAKDLIHPKGLTAAEFLNTSGTSAQHRSKYARPSPCWTGNGNFFKCKSTGLKIQQINVCHMWRHSGRADCWRGKWAVLGFLQQQRQTHSCTNVSSFTLSLFQKHHFGVMLEVVSFQEHLHASKGGARFQILLFHQRQLLSWSLGCRRETKSKSHW